MRIKAQMEASSLSSNSSRSSSMRRLSIARTLFGEKKRTWKGCRYFARYWLAWAFAIVTFVVCVLTVLVFASQHASFTGNQTNEYLIAWALSLFYVWVIIEPIEVCLLVFAPRLMEWGPVVSVRNFIKEFVA